MTPSTENTRHVESRFYGLIGTVLWWIGTTMAFLSAPLIIVLVFRGMKPLTSLATMGYVLFSYAIIGTSLAIYTVVVAIRHSKDHSRTAPERSLLNLPYVRETFWTFILLANLLMWMVRFYRARRLTD